METIYNNHTIEIFKSISSYFGENSDHYIIRCPYCGDSRKRSNTGHLYIHKYMPVFRCNRCYYGSRIDKLIKDVLGKKIKLKDAIKDNIDLNTINDKLLNSKIEYDYDINDRYRINYVGLFENNSINKYPKKYEYLYNRLKFNFERDVILSNNFVFDIKNSILNDKDLFNKLLLKFKNNQQNLINFINYLEVNYVGILTYNKTKIILRNINKEDKNRYWIMNKGNSTDYFMIDKLISNFEDIPTIVMAEGPFDVMIPYIKYIYLKEDKKYFKSFLFLSCGKSFINGLQYALLTKVVPLYNVVILSDKSSDINVNMYRKFYYYMKKYINNFTILTNDKQKDFGDHDIDPIYVDLF